MHIHKTEYTFGEIVYLRTDPNQDTWIVTDLDLKPNGLCVYTIACGSHTHTAYDFEMSIEPNESKKLGL